jgi:hypothetical protein
MAGIIITGKIEVPGLEISAATVGREVQPKIKVIIIARGEEAESLEISAATVGREAQAKTTRVIASG